MKLSELEYLIKRARELDSVGRHGDPDVRVVVEQAGTIGGLPTVGVKYASMGIDWDSGKFLIYVEPMVKKV